MPGKSTPSWNFEVGGDISFPSMAACKVEVPSTTSTSLGGSRWPDPAVIVDVVDTSHCVWMCVWSWCWVPPLCKLLQICSVGECCKIAAKMCHSQSAPRPRPAVMSCVIFMTCHECVTTSPWLSSHKQGKQPNIIWQMNILNLCNTLHLDFWSVKTWSVCSQIVYWCVLVWHVYWPRETTCHTPHPDGLISTPASWPDLQWRGNRGYLDSDSNI